MGGERLAGALYVTVSAMSFGAMAIFARFAYSSGADVVSVLFLRFVIAAALMTAVMIAMRQRWPSGRNLAILVAMGAIGYVAQSLSFFAALNYASAGLVALLLYLYPFIVTILGALFLREKLTRVRVAAVLIALAGTALTVGGSIHGEPRGVVLGVSAALLYSIYILVGDRVMREEAPLAAATVVMIAAAGVFGVMVAAEGASWPRTESGWAAVVAIAVVSTVVAMIGFFAGIQKLGAADAATLSTLEPIVTFVLAAVFLGEAIEPNHVAGGGMILAAVVWLMRSGPPIREPTGATSTSRTG